MKIENSNKENTLYTPIKLQELALEIKNKLEYKKLNIFQKIFRFLFTKRKKS